MKRLLAICLYILLSTPACAVQDTFIYTKTVIKIIPATAGSVSLPLPKDKAKSTSGDPIINPDDMMPQLKRSPKEFTVEIRTPEFLEQDGFIVHQPFSDREGMLILITPSQNTSIKATHMIASADVLFLDDDGIVFKIAPSLSLAGLREPVDSERSTHAIVFLKPGMTVSSDIRLGDRVENMLFKTHPVVIQ